MAGVIAASGSQCARAQTTGQVDAKALGELNAVPLPQPSMYAQPLPEDRGQAELVRALRQLNTTESVLYIVAHPDDEDGALLTYLSRGEGARATLLTLTRGEGGQNAMSAAQNDEMGLIRTQELLKADEYYGVAQLFGTEADFGFSKTEAESMSNWGHQRVLYDAVLAIRKTRPEIIVATFVGGVSDGHGQHQVSGEIAQEAFKAAADPKVFPEQFKNGLEPWQALAVYSRIPFARVTARGIFDYATGKWAPARFHNYVTGQWTNGPLSTDVTVPVGTWDPVLGRTYAQIAREGWGMQKSQYGGASPALDGPEESSYHLWGVAAGVSAGTGDTSLFDNAHVKIDTSVAGLARLAGKTPPAWLTGALQQIGSGLKGVEGQCREQGGVKGALALAPIYRQTLDLYTRVEHSNLSAEAKSDLEFELGAKVDEFQTAFKELLGLDLIAFRSNGEAGQGMGPRGGTADETPRAVTPGESFKVRAHVAQAGTAVQIDKIWLVSHSGSSWPATAEEGVLPENARVADGIFDVKTPEDAESTKPYFTRPNTEQPYYDISNPAWRLYPFMPWPLDAWAEFSFAGVPIRIGGVVQTLERVTGPGGLYEPLVVPPRVGVNVQPEARLLPLDGSALPVQVTVQTEGAAQGTVTLKLPTGWTATPEQAQFSRNSTGQTAPLDFTVKPSDAGVGAYSIEAVAQADGKSYRSGWHNVSYPGLLAYNQYKPAVLRTRKVDVKVEPGLHVGYVMGTGDTVPEAISELGITPHLLTDAELASADLSQWDTIAIGIRAYSSRPALAMAQPRLNDYVQRGGTLVVEYQSATFPSPLPLSVARTPVVVESDPVTILDSSAPVLNWPNKITSADFDGWFEERGHSFLETWAPGYTALTETADPGQDPQRGGWVVAHPGKGTYIYVAYALYRQLPELVPGSYRILANLLSAGHEGARR